MEETIRIRVNLLANRKEYEVEIPTGLNTHIAALLTAQALQARSDGLFAASNSCFFAKAETGEILRREVTIKENGVLSGDCLLLI